MGTRADFYVGTGADAEWIGSVAWNGGEWTDHRCDLANADSEQSFRDTVGTILGSRDDATTPDMGWPWPWNNSATTDYTYWWDGHSFRHDTWSELGWPDMSEKSNPTLGQRSGVIVVGS